MKVAITGGAGFIGTNLVYFLLENRPNWNLVVLDKLTYAGNIENISHLIESKKIAFEKRVFNFLSLATG